jgi:hypothetical protein
MQSVQTKKDLEKIVDILEERIFELRLTSSGTRNTVPLLTLRALTKGVLLTT